MPADPIPPGVRARLAGLRLSTRRAVGAQGIGLHASRSRGAGLEFAQYRPYEPGDEPRQIDWKLYARSDRYFIREAERESPVALWVLIDATASMAARWTTARALAACLGELALAGGDRFGWVVIADDGLELAVPAAGVGQRDRLRRELAPARGSGRFPAAARLAPVWEKVGPRDLVVVLSDLFDPDMVGVATRLADAGRDVAAIQLLTVAERDFDFAGGHRFRDPETGEELPGDADALRADYLARFNAARAALAAELAAHGVRMASHTADEPLDAPLRALFA
ncbi:hypothetical protein ASG29_08595 [Sphingomonas sp. Leaf412]|uniref:DUF58 domain-containing protein n=1 Tax=Sphingomonas sp. Leaf412 TaxID=1736370 RepID=UPI0006F2CC2B|nr:DUF58 domain-containing protein [Sphingomonas sp. Leaf412]KQT31926.1 hypothetical protein ASG29_08595 [Sphingomonas sp. Leaf412]